MRWNEVWNERVERKVGTGKIESMETWRKKLGKYEENWNLENMKWKNIRKIGSVGNVKNLNLEIIRKKWKRVERKWENIKKIETVENMKSENIRKIGSVGNAKNMNLEIIKKNGNVEKGNGKISRKYEIGKY